MIHCEGTLHASNDSLFETKRNAVHKDELIYAWEAGWNQEHKGTKARVATTVHEQAKGEFESSHAESRCPENEDVIAGEVKYGVKELAMRKLSTTVEESLDRILRTWFHKEQRGFRPVVYTVIEQVMLDQIRKNVSGRRKITM